MVSAFGKAVGGSADEAMAFADGDLLAVMGEQCRAAKTADAAADDDNIGGLGGGHRGERRSREGDLERR